MRYRILIPVLIFVNHCLFYEKKVVVKDESFFKDCMETIADETKCKELIKKSEKREEEKLNETKLTAEELEGLELRDKLKDRLMGQSKLYVKNSLGEPDERYLSGGSEEFFIYRRPISRYSTEHDPDKEIIVVFRRDFVSRVLHTAPDSTPKGMVPFLGDKPKKK